MFDRDSREYWNKRAATFTRTATRAYEHWLMKLLALDPSDTVLDMGCATGTLAVPLAKRGHHVHACDFAEAMLAILSKRAARDRLPITAHLLAWEDDWEAAGLGADSVDVAFASRSLVADGVRAHLGKLDSAARTKAAVTVSASPLPSYEPRLLTHLGRVAKRPHAVQDVKRALSGMDRIPFSASTTTFRPMRFASFDEARADLRRLAGPEPFTPGEQKLFDAYASEHFTCVPRPNPTGERSGHWTLDYTLPVTWTFIGWRTDGSEWE